MLKKMIDGQEIICSAEEERLIRMKWDLNEKFPEYAGHLSFDGVSEPFHLMDDCKVKHITLVNAEIQKKTDSLNDKIESAQEDGLDTASLFAQRKALKAQRNPDLSKMTKIEHLKDHLEKMKAL